MYALLALIVALFMFFELGPVSSTLSSQGAPALTAETSMSGAPAPGLEMASLTKSPPPPVGADSGCEGSALLPPVVFPPPGSPEDASEPHALSAEQLLLRLQARIERRACALARLYAPVHGRSPELRGALELYLQLDPPGNISNARIERSSLGRREINFQVAALRALIRTEFGPTGQHTPVGIVVPLWFQDDRLRIGALSWSFDLVIADDLPGHFPSRVKRT